MFPTFWKILVANIGNNYFSFYLLNTILCYPTDITINTVVYMHSDFFVRKS